MKCRRSFPVLLAIVLQAPIAMPQTAWQAVQDLPEETPVAITVKHVRGLQHCWVQSVSEDALTCDRDDQDPHRVVYGKDEIRKVYRTPEPHLERSITPPFGVGGAIVGSLPILVIFRNGPAIAIAAGMVGTAVLVKHFNHGQLVYRSPSHRHEAATVASAPRR